VATVFAMVSMTHVPVILYASMGLPESFRYALLVRLAFLFVGFILQFAILTVALKWILAGSADRASRTGTIVPFGPVYDEFFHGRPVWRMPASLQVFHENRIMRISLESLFVRCDAARLCGESTYRYRRSGRVRDGAYRPNLFRTWRRWYLGRLQALVDVYFLVFNQ